MARRPLIRTPLHRQVADLLRREIHRRHEPGQRLPSEAMLATQFGVSLVTLREALSALAQEGLLERRHGSGTYVAERSERPHIAICSAMDLGGSHPPYFQMRVVHQLMAGLQSAGQPVQVYFGGVQPGAEPKAGAIAGTGLAEAVTKRRVNGLIAIATPPDSDLIAQATAAGIPVVGDAPGFAHAVTTDIGAMIRGGIDRLADSGRTRIAVQVWEDPHGTGTNVDLVRAALAARQLEIHPEWIVSDLHPHISGSGHRGFERLWQARAQGNARSERPDGLLLCDDTYFPEAAMAILGAGIAVPRELQVVSFANQGSGIFSPFPLTALEVDPDAYANACIALLLQLLSGEGRAPERVLIPHTRREHAQEQVP